VAEAVDIFAGRMAEKDADRRAVDERITRGEISLTQAKAESEVFGRALAQMARIDWLAAAEIEIDPSVVG
jgi:hypothetical protein